MRPTLVSFHTVPQFAFGGECIAWGSVTVSQRYYAMGAVAIDADGHAWYLCEDYAASDVSASRVWKRFVTEFVE